MELTLQDGEAALLERLLTQTLGDLRMEISNTESYDMRQGLKRDEDAIKSMIRRLNPQAVL